MSSSSRKSAGKGISLTAPLLEQPALHSVLLAIFSDCRKLYPNRAMFDKDHTLIKHCCLNDLYTAWKAVNASLCETDIADTKWLRWRPTDPQGIRGIRQLVGVFTRLEGLCESTHAVDSWKSRISNSRARVRDPLVLAEARRLTASLLGAPPSIWDLIPRHGKGAVATREKDWEKWQFTTTYQQLEVLVGGHPDRPTPLSADLFHVNESYWVTHRHVCKIEKHPITRVVAVPKDLVKPRIISSEPLSMMFLQQGLMHWLYARIQSRTNSIHFSDQTVNASTCRESDHWASLDLSDASDSVSRTIVKQLVSDDWWKLLSALRSHFAECPDGTKVPIRAFAPMGSALCFPIEALVFYTTIAAYLKVYWSIVDVYVYGDDILVPVAYAEEVIAFLISIGMKPNFAKCCYKASFRESCGAEWFKGEDITVQRPRSLCDTRLMTPFDSMGSPEVLPLVDLANRAYNAQFPKLAQAFADLVKVPVSPGTGPLSANPHLRWKYVGPIRFNSDYQCLVQRIAVPGHAKVQEPADGWVGLAAYLTSGWSSRRAISASPVLRYRWVPIRP